MIVAKGIELRAGARLLLDGANFQVGPGDRVGLVGRNGAGKTTLLTVLAGEALPAAGTIRRSGAIGYLPQDPRTGDLDVMAVDRVLSSRGLDELRAGMRQAEVQMSDPDRNRADAAIRRYARLEERMSVLGGYAAEAEAAALATSLGLPDRVLHQPLGTLSGGQRRRIELARILFGDSQTLLLDEPTNHLDADSITWLRDHLRTYRGGLMVVSHDATLLDAVVNKVFHLDAQRSVIDYYTLGWRAYLQQRETDERRRKRERSNAERQAAALSAQADRMRAKATKARAAQGMQRRAERLLSGLAEERAADRVAKLRFPVPAPCGRTPLAATGLAKSYGSLEVFTDVDVAVDRGSRVVILGLNGAGKTTLLRLLAGDRAAGHRDRRARARPAARLLRAGARDAGRRAHRPGEHALGRAGPYRVRAADGARVVPVLRRRRGQARGRAVRRGEDPARAGPARGVRRERAAAGRADQQPGPGEPRGDPGRAAQLHRRDRFGHARRGGRRSPFAGESHFAAGRGRGRLERRFRGSGVTCVSLSSSGPAGENNDRLPQCGWLFRHWCLIMAGGGVTQR